MRTVGIIPARMNSERFPGKVLAEINFRPMIQWVYAAAIASDLHHVCVATDSDKIYRFCVSRAMNCHKTDQHETGSDRVAEVANKHYDADIVFNLQCDEPLLKPYMINNMIDNMIEYEADVETLGVMMHSYYLEMFKRNVVKVVHDEYRFAKQFARRIYPWEQFGKKHYPKQHVGIYAFKKQVLKDFIQLPRTVNEIDNNLEQLRLLDNNYTIHVTICDKYMIGVDRPEDIEVIEKLINRGIIDATI